MQVFAAQTPRVGPHVAVARVLEVGQGYVEVGGQREQKGEQAGVGGVALEEELAHSGYEKAPLEQSGEAGSTNVVSPELVFHWPAKWSC